MNDQLRDTRDVVSCNSRKWITTRFIVQLVISLLMFVTLQSEAATHWLAGSYSTTLTFNSAQDAANAECIAKYGSGDAPGDIFITPANGGYAGFFNCNPDGDGVETVVGLNDGSTYLSADPSCSIEGSSYAACAYNPNNVLIDKNIGDPSCDCDVGNPLNITTGGKLQPEADYLGTGGVALNMRRTYNSNSIRNGRYGARWTGTYTSFIVFDSTYPNVVNVRRDSGKEFTFTASGSTYVADGDVMDKLTRQTDANGATIGWQYRVNADDSLENYDGDGKLISIKSRESIVQTLTYSDANTATTIAPKIGLLINVSDNFNHQFSFVYDTANRVIRMRDPGNGVTTYTYDATNNLTSVTYPDNKVRTYVYNESLNTAGVSLPTTLTGIIDENDNRFATFKFDTSGRATSSEHAGSVSKYAITYTTAGSESTVTDPLGSVLSYKYQNVVNTYRNTSVTQPAGAGSLSATRKTTYDSNGNIATTVDFKGVTTVYSYDLSRNLETKRVEASGTSLARTISTKWHTNYRLPLNVAAPLLLTTYTYDTAGNMLTKTLQATTDLTGAQGLSPTLAGVARTWTYTYTAVGQVLTITGPRTDVVDKTTYVYDAQGNVNTITNSVGKITTMSNYDGNGRAGKIVDANGVSTVLNYSPRGWLTSKAVTVGTNTQTTSYAYDDVGQLTLITLPNASTISYTYDPAHRLTKTSDNLGNSIAYTLDNMGNRTNEQVKDPSGALARQTSRVIDALNRLQQITGAVQ
jgi:YD repeat-containing protein